MSTTTKKTTELDNNLYLQRIKVINDAVIGDCPICGYKDIGFNYGGNCASHPINCGWAGSFEMSCPGCGSRFGDGGHSLPKDTEHCLKFLEDKGVLNKRKEKIDTDKQYLSTFEKEIDLEQKQRLEIDLEEVIKKINAVVSTIDLTFTQHGENELGHFYYSSDSFLSDKGWNARHTAFYIEDVLEKMKLLKNPSKEKFIKNLLDNREKIKQDSIEYWTKRLQEKQIYSLVKTIGKYKIIYKESRKELLIHNTYTFLTKNFSFLIESERTYHDKYATGLEKNKTSYSKVDTIRFLENLLLEFIKEDTKKDFCAPEILKRNGKVNKLKDILNYRQLKFSIKRLENKYTIEELQESIGVNLEGMETLINL